MNHIKYSHRAFMGTIEDQLIGIPQNRQHSNPLQLPIAGAIHNAALWLLGNEVESRNYRHQYTLRRCRIVCSDMFIDARQIVRNYRWMPNNACLATTTGRTSDTIHPVSLQKFERAINALFQGALQLRQLTIGTH
jgi:hypothetical protein